MKLYGTYKSEFVPPWLGGAVDAKEAGKLMQKHRKRLRLTQDEVVAAGAVGSAQYLSALENGRYDVRNSEFFRPLAALYKLTPEQIREIDPAAVLDFVGGELVAAGQAKPLLTSSPTPIVLIPPNLRQALDILSAEDAAYDDQIFAEKLALMDPEDGNADPPVTWWLELAPVIMRRYRRR